jgi:hypothetical protein
MFGFWGFVIGPIIAALFVTIWELYGVEFREWLPTTAFEPDSGPVKMPPDPDSSLASLSVSAGIDEEQTKPANASSAAPSGSSEPSNKDTLMKSAHIDSAEKSGRTDDPDKTTG